MKPTLSDIKCLKGAGIRCRLDHVWYRWLRLLGKTGIPTNTKGGEFFATIQSTYRTLGLSEMHATVQLYLDLFVTRKGFKLPDADPEGINEILVEGRKDMLKQFTKGPPGIAREGYIQAAISYYAERFVVDVKTGEVMVCRSPMLSHELYEWDKAGRVHDVGLAVRRCADYTFDDLAMMFWCFENFSEEEDEASGESGP